MLAEGIEIESFSGEELTTLNKKTEPVRSAQEVEGVVSFHAELPVALQAAMTAFIERHPNWDQYRLIQAALAGFLVQNGVESRSITRLYIGNMFRSQSMIEGVGG